MSERDTSSDARRVLLEIYRRMPPHLKAKLIFDAYHMGKVLAIAGLRQSHPTAGPKEIWQLWAKRHLGEALFNRAYGAAPNE